MNKRLIFFTFIMATLLAGCTSTPTRINGLNLENSGFASNIELNGVLISHDDKFILDSSFQVPTVPHGKETDYVLGENSVYFTSIPTGPWEFNGSTLFPGFRSSSTRCDSEDCDYYKQSKGPFIQLDCDKFYTPNSSITYSKRLNEIIYEETKIEREKETKVDYEFTTFEIIQGSVGIGLLSSTADKTKKFAF